MVMHLQTIIISIEQTRVFCIDLKKVAQRNAVTASQNRYQKG